MAVDRCPIQRFFCLHMHVCTPVRLNRANRSHRAQQWRCFSKPRCPPCSCFFGCVSHSRAPPSSWFSCKQLPKLACEGKARSKLYNVQRLKVELESRPQAVSFSGRHLLQHLVVWLVPVSAREKYVFSKWAPSWQNGQLPFHSPELNQNAGRWCHLLLPLRHQRRAACLACFRLARHRYRGGGGGGGRWGAGWDFAGNTCFLSMAGLWSLFLAHLNFEKGQVAMGRRSLMHKSIGLSKGM